MDLGGGECHGRYRRTGERTLPRTPERNIGLCHLSAPEAEAQAGQTTPTDMGGGDPPVPAYIYRSRSAERVAVVAHRVKMYLLDTNIWLERLLDQGRSGEVDIFRSF